MFRFDTQKSRSQSLPRNIRTEDLERNDSDMSYDPLERSIFQRARQTSQEVDRQTRQGRQVEKRSGNSTPRFNRPRSVGATLNRSGHLSGSDGNRYHSNISSSGPDTDRRTDNESYDRRRTINRAGGARRNVEYVSVTNVSRDGTIGNTSMLRMDDKNGETRWVFADFTKLRQCFVKFILTVRINLHHVFYGPEASVWHNI